MSLDERLGRTVGRPLFWVIFLGVIFALPIVRSVRARLPPPLPVLGTIGNFVLTDERGEPFGSAQLRGRGWGADFVFTRCPTECPLLTERMGKVQHRARNLGNAFQLVSFSVDPEWDTPARLQIYARTHRASPRMWAFLTGPYQVIRKTVIEATKVGIGRGGSSGPVADVGSIFHDSHVVLVDAGMRVRGYYDVSSDDGIDTLMRDIGMLVARGE